MEEKKNATLENKYVIVQQHTQTVLVQLKMIFYNTKQSTEDLILQKPRRHSSHIDAELLTVSLKPL